MSSSRAVVSAFVLALVAVLIGAAPAGAGGPTSVLLVASSGATTSLYYNDTDYQALAEQLGAFGGDVSSGKFTQGDHSDGGRAVTVTWLIHDVTVWRVDFIHVDARGGPWIRTLQSLDTSRPIWDDAGYWHRAADPKALTSLLTRLGVVGAPPAAVDTGSAPVAPADQAPARVGTGTASQVADDEPASSRPAAWGLGGLLTGVLLTLGGAALRARRRRRVPEVAEETLVTPVPVGPDDAEEWRGSVEEELVSTNRR